MMELEMDNLTSIKLSEEQYEKQHVGNEGTEDEEEELLMKEISEYIGFKSFHS